MQTVSQNAGTRPRGQQHASCHSRKQTRATGCLPKISLHFRLPCA